MSSLHDFSALYAHYPAIIEQMPAEFTSHEFILRLAQQHQDLYVEALYSYRNTTYMGTPAPFMNVHSQLAKHLREHADFVEDEHPSKNIFGDDDTCALWRKR